MTSDQTRKEARKRRRRLHEYIRHLLPSRHGANSMKALARAAGIRPSTISRWGTRGNKSDPDVLALLAAELRVTPGDLLDAYYGAEPPLPTVTVSEEELWDLLRDAAAEGARIALDEARRGRDT